MANAFLRPLAYGASGEDVLYIKRRLLAAGFYDAAVTDVRRLRFGSDTRAAVWRFQRANGLPETGEIDRATWERIVCADAARQETNAAEPAPAALGDAELGAHIGPAAAKALGKALDNTHAVRRKIVLDALQYAFDPTVPRAYPISLYIRGGNLYNRDLKPNVITLARIASGAKAQPEFYDGGRREMMERAVRTYPNTTGADCSGGVVGLLRHAGLVERGFDSTADGFYRSGCMRRIEREALVPADLVHRSGHIGLYAGGGYAVEWMGGAFGCQLTKLVDRRGWNFVTGKTVKMSAWTGFLRPTYD